MFLMLLDVVYCFIIYFNIQNRKNTPIGKRKSTSNKVERKTKRRTYNIKHILKKSHFFTYSTFNQQFLTNTYR